MFDGEQFSKGFVEMDVVRVRAGVQTTVATFARAEAENMDGANLPWNQDPGMITALAGDTYYVRVFGNADYCTRARLLGGGMDFVRVG